MTSPHHAGRASIRFLNILFLLISLGLFFFKPASAASVGEHSASTARLFPRYDYPDDYPYPKKDDCTNTVQTQQDKSLFYTGLSGYGLTGKHLQTYKKQAGLYIVGGAFTYPSGFVDPKTVGDDDKDAAYYAQFADDFSEAFAEKSSGQVFLLLNMETDPNNPDNGHCSTTWYRKEYPALKANSDVTKITQVDPTDFTNTKQIWPATSNNRIFKRANATQCLDWDQGTPPNLEAPPTGDEDSTPSPSQTSAAATSTPTPASSPLPAYATGTCSFHVDEYQDCADDSQNLFANITMYDNNKAVIGQTAIDPTKNPIGDPINTSDPYSFSSKLSQPMIVTGEHANDYVQFTIGSLSFTSRTTTGPATCSNGGWNPRDGPVCGQKYGDQNAVWGFFIGQIFGKSC